MKNYILKLKIVFACVIVLLFFLNCKNIYSQNDDAILRTDSVGNILGGDKSDWDFNKKNYKEIRKYNYLFRSPSLNDGSPIPVSDPLDESFTYEIIGEDLILKWFTSRETNNKGFYVERAESISENNSLDWTTIGFVKGHVNSMKEKKYKFSDKSLKEGTYGYRLKQVSFKDEVEYFNLPYKVKMIKYINGFEFYPAYPNPVDKTSTISFYLPKRDIVSLYFLNGKDTVYVLNPCLQEIGFYKLTIDKNSLGFENEIKRLYIDCKSCNKKKNFGDIKFN